MIFTIDDDFKGMENDARSHDVQRQSFNDNNHFGATIGRYDYNLNGVVDSADMGDAYDDSYDEDDFNEDDN